MPPLLRAARPRSQPSAIRPTRRRWLGLFAGLAVGATAIAVATIVIPVVDVAGQSASPTAAAPQPPTPAPDAPCAGEAPAKADGSTWQCTWSDEFAGTELSEVWELIPYGLGGSCLFNEPEYVSVSDGFLHLTARKLPADHWCNTEYGLQYGSGGIQSSNGFAQQYGRFEIRAKVPAGVGFWPAIWMLPDDDSFDGEIDILEAYGGRDNNADTTLHSPSAGPGPNASCALTPDLTSVFHTYRMEWSAERIAVFYDDQLCAVFTGDVGEASSIREAFDKPYHLLINLATQNWWPPDATTPFPSTMLVDYVRAWR